MPPETPQSAPKPADESSMADKSDIIDEIERLTVHCRPPIMEADLRAGWLADWCADLAEFPIEAVRLAIRDWRHGGQSKFPTPGQLLPLVRARLPAQKGPKVEVWREPTEDEYRAMTVREKIRHHHIMAHEAGVKAGPMWRNPEGAANIRRPMPGHLTIEEMPPTYHHWKRMQANHAAEAKRLREMINKADAA